MPCPEGYRIVFCPKKQKNQPKSPDMFLIPKSNGLLHSLFSDYVECVNKDICPSPNETLWYCGRVLKNGQTKFVKQNFGMNRMRDVPRFLAKKLSKKDSILRTFMTDK